MCLMDATYKTTHYDLPLFFICVRTNAGYCVVAKFIVQSESATNIIEALQLIMSWNPQWKPQFFITDCSEAEISALESCFPSTTVYLCDFSTGSKPGNAGQKIISTVSTQMRDNGS